MSIDLRLQAVLRQIRDARSDAAEFAHGRIREVVASIQREVNNLRTEVARDLPGQFDELLSFSAMHTLGFARREVRHTQALRWALDPTAPHKLGEDVTSRFLRRVGVQRPQCSFKVGAERHLDSDSGRSDLILEWREFAVLIENKVDDVAREDQLGKYRRFAEKTFGTKFALVYLTPCGDRPPPLAEADEHVDDWTSISYTDVAVCIFGALAKSDDSWARRWLNLYAASLLGDIVGIQDDKDPVALAAKARFGRALKEECSL